jgi:gluconolactonase
MIFVEDILSPEGPVLLTDESWLVVEMAPERGCVTWISADGHTKRLIAKTGGPNGLAVDWENTIWVADTKQRALLRMSMDGRWEVFLNACQGRPFVFPNDLVFGPDGALYITDSGIADEELAPGGAIRSDYDRITICGFLYRVDVRTKHISVVDSGIRYPNGLAFGPGGELYVAETMTGNVYRYRWERGTVSGERQFYGNVISPRTEEGFRGPDGMKFGGNGNLYVAVYGQGDVTVLGKAGEVAGRIPTLGRNPTNCAFGLKGSKKLFITELELNRMEVVDVGVDGLPLYTGK